MSSSSLNNSPVVSRSPSPEPVLAAEPERAVSQPVGFRRKLKVRNTAAEVSALKEQHAAEMEQMRERIAELEAQLEAEKTRKRSSAAPKEKKYKGQRIKKEKMEDYHKAALEETCPEGWCEPKAHGNFFTHGIPLRDDGSLIETGYIYNGLRWTTDQFAEAVACCEARADIRSLHYEKGYWHAKTGAIVRGKSGENSQPMRVFVFGTDYDEAALKVEQKNSAHGGEQNLKQTLLRWAEIKGEMSATEFAEHFRSVRFPEVLSGDEIGLPDSDAE
jgi:hypothetical protein